nr:MAG TPA: nucleoside triphosphate pyrophosphohydrolase [Caudoviricetes sp.]
MSELIKAICKMRRAGVNEKPAATDAIVDEIADVSIMMEQLCMMYECFDAVENRRQYKVRRLANRLKEAPACSK